VAVTFAVPSAVRVPVFAVKVPEDPARMLTLAGTVRATLLLLRVTVIPPFGTGFENVTVQELLAFDPKLLGVQTTELTVKGDTRLMLELADEPL
jgi:hypothetical protein